MPLKESVCINPACSRRGLVEEHYYSRTDSQIQSCAECGTPERQIPSRFNVPFLGPMTARYNDKKIPGAHVEGHWATRKRTLDGRERMEWIDSWDKQKQFCKEEGLILPSDLPSTPTLKSGSGKEWSTVGMPGSWSSLPAELQPAGTLSTGRRLSDAEISVMFPGAVDLREAIATASPERPLVGSQG